MRLKITFCLLMLIICFSVKAQNLVPNPSFEEHVQCPDGPDELNYATSWYSPNGASSDYFNLCATNSYLSVPNNIFGFQYAKTGDGYAGIIVYHLLYNNYREYIRCQLIQQLDTNKHYCVEFNISLSDSSKFAISNIGAYFSDINNVTTSGGLLNYQPQISNADTTFLTNKTNWVKISGCFLANGGEKYLTIGNFNDDFHCDTISTQTHGIYEGALESYYYIDDIIVIEDSNVELNNYNAIKFSIFPNPCINYFKIVYSSNEVIKRILLLNEVGNMIKDYNETKDGNLYNVKDIENGIYILKITFSDNTIINSKLIINH